ncbi:PRK06851 family protein [Mesobacillus subterraneus]|uniref:PRK06851 family protein n=1 Tax=Mesobacillus subterraneus TaxID=285983 RepID=UPI00203D0C14|nr:PRK06851 family protein [Mesobacillus subterraneus]MCM3664537.1 PRK06851 family protein [Mesobacillus subterraneus]MCM3683947.1 PRK06851 family protein [Mesobacillus subterraneus]
MSGKILNYFAGGNTARGFYSLYDSNLQGLSRLFILKGGPGTGKSSLMKKIGNVWLEKGYDIEFLHCSSDNKSIDGVLIPKLNAGIVDGTAPHVIEPKAPGAVEEYVNLGEAWDSGKLKEHKVTIQQLSEKISSAFNTAYSQFAEALRIHDEWEKIYIENMDFEKANDLTNRLIERFFGDKSSTGDGRVHDRFLGAATPVGAVDFVPNLTETVGKRYFIKGRPGSGKSTMLKKLAAEAQSRGYDVEVYHCGFDPHSLDMVIVRELDFAIFDSTAPHEYFPERETDEIIDMYDELITPGTDEKYASEIEDVGGRYKAKMSEAIASLANAKVLRDQLEKIYIEAMDFTKVDALASQIQKEIETLSAD